MDTETTKSEPNRPQIIITDAFNLTALLSAVTDGLCAYRDDFFPEFVYQGDPLKIPQKLAEILVACLKEVDLEWVQIEIGIKVPIDCVEDAQNRLKACLEWYAQAIFDALNTTSSSGELWEKAWEILETGYSARTEERCPFYFREGYVYSFVFAAHLPEMLVDKVLASYLRVCRYAQGRLHSLSTDKEMNRALADKIREARLAHSPQRFKTLGIGAVNISPSSSLNEERLVMASLPVQSRDHQNSNHIPREIFRGFEKVRDNVCLQIWQTMSGLSIVLVGVQDLENSCGCGHCSYDGGEVVMLDTRRYSIRHEMLWVVDAVVEIFLEPAEFNKLVEQARAKVISTTKLLALLK